MEVQKRKLGEHIKTLRHAKSLSQADLGDRAGCSEYTISYVERGKGFPTLDSLINISNALEVPIEEIVLVLSSQVKTNPKLLKLQALGTAMTDTQLDIALKQLQALSEG